MKSVKYVSVIPAMAVQKSAIITSIKMLLNANVLTVQQNTARIA